jgi:flagellar biosynthesis protein FlhG
MRMVAVGGGKGGIGKTLVATSLALELARRGKEVVLVDADLGGANVHTCLGIDAPLSTLSDFISKRVARVQDVAVATGTPHLRLVSGALDALDAGNPRFAQKQKLLRHLSQLDVDYVVLDLGAGTHFNVLDFFLAADRGVVVVVPEPTCIENVYRFVKAAFYRRLHAQAEDRGLQQLLAQAITAKGGARPLWALLEDARKVSPEAEAVVRATVAGFRPGLVVNQARSGDDVETGHAMVAAWRKYFGLEMDFLGALHHDDEVWRSVRRRHPVMLDQPDGRIAHDFASVVDHLLVLDAGALKR